MQDNTTSNELQPSMAETRSDQCDEACLNDSDQRCMGRRTFHSVSSNDMARSIFERYGAEF